MSDEKIVEQYMFRNPLEIMTLEDKYIELIIRALQMERKNWIRQFTKAHNEGVAINKENQKLKNAIIEAQDFITGEISLNDSEIDQLAEILDSYRN